MDIKLTLWIVLSIDFSVNSSQTLMSFLKHSSDLCHQIDYSNPAVISVDNNDYRLQIKEALKIKDLKAYNSLNANIRSCELKLW